MPIYINDKNLKVVDMCQIFDEEFPLPNRDDEKLFKYLYMIIYAVTLKEKRSWFSRYEDFDGYAMYAATTLYMRFIKKQKEGEQVVSVLNYFKSCWDKLKIMYQNEEFDEIMKPGHKGFNSSNMAETIQSSLNKEYFAKDKEEDITLLLNNVHSKAQEVIKESPYSKDYIMSHRLYISMLMTLLSNLTLSNKNNNKLVKRINKSAGNDDKIFTNLLEKEKQESPILWHLDKSMGDYVKLLVNKMKFKLSKELRDISNYYVLPEDVVTSIMASAYGENYVVNEEEY